MSTGLPLSETNHTSAELRLEQQHQELIKTNAELDRFVYSVSHELRSPLTSVLGLINIMRTEEDDKEKRVLLDLMQSSIEKLDVLIGDIVDYSKNARQHIFPEKIDFKTLIETNLTKNNFSYGSQKIKFDVSISGVDFHSDKNRVQVIVNSLLSNAIKYRNPELANSTVKVDVRITSFDAHIKVSDNGLGIAPTHLNRIFEMFYRGTSKKSGAGLGLYIVKEAVDKLGGSIRVESTEGKGSNFFLTLPNMPPAILVPIGI